MQVNNVGMLPLGNIAKLVVNNRSWASANLVVIHRSFRAKSAGKWTAATCLNDWHQFVIKKIVQFAAKIRRRHIIQVFYSLNGRANNQLAVQEIVTAPRPHQLDSVNIKIVVRQTLKKSNKRHLTLFEYAKIN